MNKIKIETGSAAGQVFQYIFSFRFTSSFSLHLSPPSFLYAVGGGCVGGY